MKKQMKLYNIILPVWLIVSIPSLLWLAVIPANLGVDCLVCFLALRDLGHPDGKCVLKQIWWKIWLLGFAADAIGVAWMLLGCFLSLPFGAVWEESVGHITHNAFAHPAAFLWALAGVAISGVCIYFFDRRAMKSCEVLDRRQKHVIALTLALVTAPWMFFIPIG